MRDAVSSKILSGLAARFGLRARRGKQDTPPPPPCNPKRARNSAPQESVPWARKKLRLESGEVGLAQEGDEDTGKACGDVGLATESDAAHLARHHRRGKTCDDKCSRCKLCA